MTLTALEEIGEPFETRLIAFMAGEHRRPAYLAVNPSGKVPALDTGSGVVTQNGSILLYLARTRPDAGLLPLTGEPLQESAIVSALFRFSSDLHPLVTRFVLPGMMLCSNDAAPQVREKAEELLLQQLHPIDAQLDAQPWVLGGNWSILDSYLAWIWFRITGAGFDHGIFPAIATHYERAGERPSARAALAHEKRAMAELVRRGLSFTPPRLKTEN
ncbi:glutathione S-transferase family protein [Altererythrobacter sediminis]|uniref:Glutathione S-transferase family protein n=1 Tax=Allopontixanthobacter sediminis TaxID=1689985 RepID=A0A845B8H8_9SPHN|nr:glutathione S-transferase family protein [Allopontixanthobacter sediminis]